MPVAKNRDQVSSGNPQNLKLLLEKDGIMKGRYLVWFHLMYYKTVFMVIILYHNEHRMQQREPISYLAIL